jgi:hypothetical protein
MRKSLWFALALLIVSVGVPGAQANSLDSQQVEIDYIFPTLGTVLMNLGSGTVTAAGFTVNSFGQNDYTVTDTQIVLENVFGSLVLFGTSSFNGYELTETGSSPVTITAVTLDAATNVSGVSSSNVSFNGTHVWLNMSGITTNNGQVVVLDVTSGSTAVPESGTGGLVLAGLGLIAFVVMMRKRIPLGLPQAS